MIASPGRVGSLHVARAISISTGFKIVNDYTINKQQIEGPLIYHTHNATLQLPDTDNLTVVCCTRKNLYASTISAIIGEMTNEWGSYSGTCKPFTVDKDTVEQKYVWHRWWQYKFDTLTSYKNKFYLEFETFTKNTDMIFETLNLPKAEVPIVKSPYTEQHIININDVKKWISEFENNPSLKDFALNTFEWHDGKVND